MCKTSKTKTASTFEGDINILNREHNLEYDKKFTYARLVFGQEEEQ